MLFPENLATDSQLAIQFETITPVISNKNSLVLIQFGPKILTVEFTGFDHQSSSTLYFGLQNKNINERKQFFPTLRFQLLDSVFPFQLIRGRTTHVAPVQSNGSKWSNTTWQSCDPEKQTLKLHTTCITQQNDKQGLDN